jgi:DNA repair ATPase RecN
VSASLHKLPRQDVAELRKRLHALAVAIDLQRDQIHRIMNRWAFTHRQMRRQAQDLFAAEQRHATLTEMFREYNQRVRELQP